MLGPSLLITPALDQGATTVDGVFPGLSTGTRWYDWYNQTAVSALPYTNTTIDAPLGHIPVYIRGGSVLPQQEPLLTTAACRNSSWSLIAALDIEGSATGTLYVDDGESLVQEKTLLVDFTVAGRALYASGRGLYADANALANVTVLGVAMGPSGNGTGVTLNGATVPAGSVSYDGTGQVLKVTGLQNMTQAGAWAQDWVLRW